MKRKLSLIFGLSAALSLGAFACGDDEKDKNSDIECSSDADCAGNTDSGKITCDLTAQICVVPSTSSGCASDEECASGICANGECATTKMAPCTDPNIEHAVANTDAMVQVTFEDGAWQTAGTCPWICGSGYQQNDDKTGCEALPACTTNDDCRSKLCDTETNTCATTKQDKCKAYTDAELAALNATAQDSDATVTWTYIESSDGSAGWTTDGKCALTACVDGYELDESGNACVSTTDRCTKDSDCAGNTNSGKTYCYISEGANEGSCIVPECNVTADCEEGHYCEMSTHTCEVGCTYDADCLDPSKPVCDWEPTSPTYFTCVESCDLNTCDANGRACGSDGRWKECDAGRTCENGLCVRIIDEAKCTPACTDGKQCILNTNNSTDPANYTYACQWTGSQKKDLTLRITQIYLGDASNQPPETPLYNKPFIELYNYGNQAIDLKAKELLFLYGTKAGNFQDGFGVDFAADCSDNQCVVNAGSYFRIENRKNTDTAGAAPNGAISFTTNIGINGTYAITTKNVPTGTFTCQDALAQSYDLVGIGEAACFEGDKAAAGIDASNRGIKSYKRDDVTIDSNDNWLDFTPATPSLN